jgi:hypothetical protein
VFRSDVPVHGSRREYVICLWNRVSIEHPWTLRRGSCAHGGGQVVVPFATADGQADIAEPLRPNAEGHVQTVVDVPVEVLTLEELNEAGFSLVVHANLRGDSVSTAPMACADLGR